VTVTVVKNIDELALFLTAKSVDSALKPHSRSLLADDLFCRSKQTV
jgi:hypothetical protein